MKPPRPRPIVLAVGALAVLLTGLYFLCVSFIFPIFNCQTITVNSPDFISTESLRSHVDASLGQEPVWMAWMPSFKRALIRTFPPLIDVKPQFINKHTVHITFETKPPWIAYMVDQDIRIYSEDGTWLNQHETFHNEAVIQGLPIIKQDPVRYLESNKNWQAFYAEISPMVNILSATMPSHNIQLNQHKTGNWMFYYLDKTPVKIGDSENFQQKLDAFLAFQNNHPSATTFKAIDLRIPGKIFVEI